MGATHVLQIRTSRRFQIVQLSIITRSDRWAPRYGGDVRKETYK